MARCKAQIYSDDWRSLVERKEPLISTVSCSCWTHLMTLGRRLTTMEEATSRHASNTVERPILKTSPTTWYDDPLAHRYRAIPITFSTGMGAPRPDKSRCKAGASCRPSQPNRSRDSRNVSINRSSESEPDHDQSGIEADFRLDTPVIHSRDALKT